MNGIHRKGENWDKDKHRGKMVWSHREQTDIYKPRREAWSSSFPRMASEGTSFADTLFLDPSLQVCCWSPPAVILGHGSLSWLRHMVKGVATGALSIAIKISDQEWFTEAFNIHDDKKPRGRISTVLSRVRPLPSLVLCLPSGLSVFGLLLKGSLEGSL